jgi:short-subunit dehydrogenase
MNLPGRTALVTGATGGLGQAIARRLARDGATLIVTGRRAEVLEPLAAEIGGRALSVDLADAAAVERLAADCADVDVLVANAAVPASGHLLSFSVEEIDRALAVNLRAPMVLSRLLGERMADRSSGHIVLISSLSGKFGSQGSAVYSATKFGLRGFGQGLRGDLRSRGVGVSVVFPGFVRDAGMFHDSGTQLPSLVRTSTPEQVADAVARAIEHDRGEVDVAPVPMRAGATLWSLAPGVTSTIARRLGSERVTADLGAGQRAKRT